MNKNISKTAKPDQNQPILTKRQEAFILALIKNGGDVTQAALDAGYSSKSAPVMGYQNLRTPYVLEAYEALLRTKLASGKALSLKVLEDVARTSESDHAKVTAANSIWDKADRLEGLAKGHTGGMTININMGSDLHATKTIEHEAQPIDDVSTITSKEGDEVSDER